MSLPNIDWASYWYDIGDCKTKATPGSAESRAFWDNKAPAFAHKQKRSGYIEQLIELMALAPGESVLDVGCGSGTLAVPLAAAGHHIVALDFSPAMLNELHATAQAAGAPVAAHIQTFERAWQQNWDDIPCADVAISSRSLVTQDLADAINKMEAHAHKRCIISTGAGDMPIRDHKILLAMGRPEEQVMKPDQLIIILNHLFDLGRMPRVEYIQLPGRTKRETREELIAHIYAAHQPETPEEDALLDAYLEQHIIFDTEENCWMLDYDRINTWAYIEWTLPQ